MINTLQYNKCPVIEIETNGGYTVEQILNNKNCSKDPKYWYRISDTDRFLFKSDMAESWEFFYPAVKNPIRNTNQIYLKFKNSIAFCEQANNFKRDNTYFLGFPGTYQYEKYWDDQEDILLDGLIIDGVRITGRHYFALNFGRINAIPTDETGKSLGDRKIDTFLRFLDHQYYLLNEIEESLLEGPYLNMESYLEWFPAKTEEDFYNLKKQNFLSVKARRKGFSYIVDNAIFAYTFSFVPYSNTKLFAHEKSAFNTTLKGMKNTLNWLNNHTEFGKRRIVLNKYDHFRASFKMINDLGIEIEDGFMSEFQASSFKDNPFKSVGEAASIVGVEEAGIFDNLLETFAVSIEPLIRDGEILTGVALIWGSVGSMESGNTLALKDMMYQPGAFNIKKYTNIYEPEERQESVSWFIDDLWYSPSRIRKKELLKYEMSEGLKAFIEENYTENIEGVDINGNSHRWISKLILEAKRKKASAGSIRSYQKMITQQPMFLSEAFLVNENSPFDTAMASEALAELKSKDERFYETGTFSINKEGNIIWNPNPMLIPVMEHNWKGEPDGCWVVYNRPENNVDWRYISGCDPIDFGYDESDASGANKHSMAATFIVDTLTRNVVAEYVGRPRTAELYYEQLWRGLQYFNAQLLYENNLKGLFSYFRTKNKLYLLADEPQSLKDKWGYKANNKVKGFHATEAINSYARELIHKWSTEEEVVGQYDNGETKSIPRMFLIPSIGVLEEMIRWFSKGNFDRISGLGATMLLLFDREIILQEVNEQTKSFFSGKVFKNIKRKFNKDI
jgi:hypothetical protein